MRETLLWINKRGRREFMVKKKIYVAVGVAAALVGGLLGVTHGESIVDSKAEIYTYEVIDCLTPEYGTNVVRLGEPFMATEDGFLVVPTEELERDGEGVTYLCSDGSNLFIEGTAVTVSPQ
jgi:hypothetical protein